MAAWFVEPLHGDLHSDGVPGLPGQPYRDKEHRSVKVTMNNFQQLYMEVGGRGPRILCLNLKAENCAQGDCAVPEGLLEGENCTHMAFSVNPRGGAVLYVPTSTGVPNVPFCFGSGARLCQGEDNGDKLQREPLAGVQNGWKVTADSSRGCNPSGADCWYFDFEMDWYPKE